MQLIDDVSRNVLAVGDLDGDGHADLVTRLSDGRFQVRYARPGYSPLAHLDHLC